MADSRERYEATSDSRRTCVDCGDEGGLDKFYRNRRNRCGLQSRCKPCHVKKISTPERKAQRRDSALYQKYGIRQADYDAILNYQNGSCAICDTTETNFYGWFHVDHDHTTGEVRGLLCHKCNIDLAPIEDKQFLERATAYLQYTPATQAGLTESTK